MKQKVNSMPITAKTTTKDIQNQFRAWHEERKAAQALKQTGLKGFFNRMARF
jgi:hypothetical protein